MTPSYSQQHPAARMPFDELIAGLRAEVQNRNVTEKRDGPLSLFTYTNQCTYSKAWNPFTLSARGLILDTEAKRVAAYPFPKFFNYGETEWRPDPAMPFTVTEKLDGSLGIVFHNNGRWRVATKGSFFSEQAQWAERWLAGKEAPLVPGFTYLFEIIYPENRIVVPYSFSGMVLLSAYNPDGWEIARVKLPDGFRKVGLAAEGASIDDLLAAAKSLKADKEGFVVRWGDGHRVKIKGDEYCRLHRLISGVTPLAVWEAMLAQDDTEKIRMDLPEEFRKDVDSILSLLSTRLGSIVEDVERARERFAGSTDKEVGISLASLPDHVRALVFQARKRGASWATDPMTRRKLFSFIRPDANHLPGYTPSSAMNRFSSEAA